MLKNCHEIKFDLKFLTFSNPSVLCEDVHELSIISSLLQTFLSLIGGTRAEQMVTGNNNNKWKGAIYILIGK